MHASNARRKDEDEEPGLEYLFVSGTSGSYSKNIRAHVLKRHLRTKLRTKAQASGGDGNRATDATSGSNPRNFTNVDKENEKDSQDARPHGRPPKVNPQTVRTSVAELERSMMLVKGPGSESRQKYLISYC
jgi:hypothetical protein